MVDQFSKTPFSARSIVKLDIWVAVGEESTLIARVSRLLAELESDVAEEIRPDTLRVPINPGLMRAWMVAVPVAPGATCSRDQVLGTVRMACQPDGPVICAFKNSLTGSRLRV